MFKTKQKKSVLGIDIGSRATKIVQLKFSGHGKPQLDFCDVLNTGFFDEGFAANLRAYVRDADLKNSLAAVSFDHDSLVIRKIELPKMPLDELKEAVKWNLREYIDGDIEDFTVVSAFIGEKEAVEGEQNEYMGFAIKRNAVADFRFQIEQFGLSPIFIEPKDVSLASALDRCFPDEEHFLAGVDIGCDRPRFYVVGKRNFVFTRPLTAVRYDLFQKEPEDYRQKLAIELQKSIDTFQVNFDMQPLHSLHLSGGGALIPELPEYLQTNLGIKTLLLNPFETLSGTEHTGELRPELFPQAVSLAYLQL